ncbi:Uncharacterised protein [uncultured archaeon]|nr:Uncharacterised protein [uncultured archaeon]
MSSNIISSYRSFSERFQLPNDEKRTDAIKFYFRNGGVISASGGGKGKWPKLSYPSPMRVEEQIREFEKLNAEYGKKHKEWKQKLSDAKTYHAKHHVLKFSEPLYWKHTAKALSDKSYKEDAEKVGLPVHLVADNKWKPMVRMFLEDQEYRRNLVETVQTSVVYKHDRKVAKYADTVQEFRSGISNSKLKELESKIKGIDSQIAALEEIKKWAGE